MSKNIPEPKILIVISRSGVESVTVSASDSTSREFGYKLCRNIEKEIKVLNELVKSKFRFVADDK